MQPDGQATGPVSLGQVPCCDDRHELLAATGLESDGPRPLAMSPELALEAGFRAQPMDLAPYIQKNPYPLGYAGPPLPVKDVVLAYRVLLI